MQNVEFTDIHCHIIPQVDDGSDSIETSLKLVNMMYEDGIRTVITTPHFGIINPTYDPDKVKKQFDLLSKAVDRIYPDMKLYRGNEIFVVPGYSDGLDDRMSCTLAGSEYVLVEFEDGVDYDTIYSEFRKLMIRGYCPIFAHAERYMGAYKNIKGLRALVKQGVMIQINSSSICEMADSAKRRFRFKNYGSKLLKEMLQEGLIHFIGTDCHDMPGREPRMTEAAEVMEELIGEERTLEILVENPKIVLGKVYRSW